MRSVCATLALLALPPVCFAQNDGALPTRVNGGGTVAISAKRAITPADYASWKSIAGAQLSRDGVWAAYAVNPAEGDGELTLKRLDGSALWKVARGGGVRFSYDGRWALITVAAPFAESEAARKAKKEAPKSAAALIDLTSGKVETLEKVRRAAFPDEGAGWLALHTEAQPAQPAPTTPAVPAKTDQAPQSRRQRPGGAAPTPPGGAGAMPGGTELTLRPLGPGAPVVVSDVSSFQFDRTGKLLIYIVDAKDDAKDGVYARTLATGATTTLASGPGTYAAVALDEAGAQVAFLFTPKPVSPAPAGGSAPTLELRLWRVGQKAAESAAGVKPSENAPPRFSKDGSYVVFGSAPTAPPKPKEVGEPVTFELWSTYDGLIPTMKKVQATAEARRTHTAIYRIAEKKIISLADEKLRDVSVGSEAKKLTLGFDGQTYLAEMSYDGSYRDVSLVSLVDGARRQVLTHHGGAVSLSPDEKWLLWWDGKTRSWLSQDAEGKTPPRNLTGALKASFAEEDWDTPGEPNSYGLAGWTSGDKEIIIYDRFDLWAISPETGAARRLTQGREHGIVFRYARLDSEERQLPEGKPWLLASTDDETRAMGYWRLAADSGALTKLFIFEGALGGLQKAKDASTVLFTRERFEVFPDLWSAPSVDAMSGATKLTDANPQQKEVRWGRSERILYRTADGKELPAILTVPEDLDPTKKYPLLVYIYEKLAQGLHRYQRPAPSTSINVSRYVSNGYVVLQPDIEYREGYPGESALACVVPAVHEILRRGYIDEKRIGLQGHSWGAYQTTYLITRTNLFRAVEAGASVANMFSAYGGIRYESGLSRQFQYEKTQSRIGATPWQKPLAYLENSPIFWADKVQTPYLSVHNDADGAVPYTQGIEFFMALKRLGKEAFLFNYNGEGHGITGRENQKHWAARMAEFFDHYLLNAPRSTWMNASPAPQARAGEAPLRTPG